jgi:hypothetical protein
MHPSDTTEGKPQYGKVEAQVQGTYQKSLARLEFSKV